MPDVYYPSITAGDAASIQSDGSVVTSIVPPNSFFQVFELSDTGYSAPLTIKSTSGLTDTKVPVGALPIFPDVYVVSPNFAHLWKSGDLVFRRDSADAKDKAVADALAAAQEAASNAGAAAEAELAERIAAGEFKGDPGAPGSNTIPTEQAIASLAVVLNAEVNGVYPPRPNGPVVAWVGFTDPDAFMGEKDYWVDLAAPAPLTLPELRALFLDPTSSLTTAAGNGIAAGASLWVPATAFAPAVGAPTLNGISSTYLANVAAWRFDPAIVEAVAASVVVPRGWATAKIALFFTSIGTGGGSVRFIVNMNSLNPGALVSASSQNLEPNIDIPTTANTVGQLVPASNNSYAVNPAVPLRIAVGRRADNATFDTCPDDIGFVGLMLTRLS
ncbi:hypothetical protein ACX80I_00970 [Arthrobacter sp. MDT3-44]